MPQQLLVFTDRSEYSLCMPGNWAITQIFLSDKACPTELHFSYAKSTKINTEETMIDLKLLLKGPTASEGRLFPEHSVFQLSANALLL